MKQARYFLDRPEKRALATRLHEHIVEEISKLADRAGIEVWFILLPTKYQIEPDTQVAELVRLEEVFGLDPRNKFEDWVHSDFGAIVRERGLKLVDPREAFIASPEELYLPHDHHLNVAGSRKLGEILADEIDRFIARIDATRGL